MNNFSNIFKQKSFLLSVFAVISLSSLLFWATDKDEPASATVTVPMVAAPAPVIEVIPDPDANLQWKEGRFGKKLFFKHLQEQGIASSTVQKIVDSLTPVYNFRKSNPRHLWRVGFENEEPKRFVLEVSPTEIYDLYDLDQDIRLEQREVKIATKRRIIRGEIQGSLYEAINNQPSYVSLAAKLEQVYAWDINFHKDLRQGDTFEVLVEEKFIINGEDATFNGYGDIIAARYFAGNVTLDAFKFTVGDEDGYYNSKGESLIRDVLRSPLKLSHVTSSFKTRRFHPVLKKVRPHNGVDYRASRGTPVMAVANGRVKRAGRYGGAGIMIELNHPNGMLTQYFHFSRLAPGMKRGVKVKQGQVIGYVGKTGLATADHLHFGMKMNGKFVDPLKQRYRPGKAINDALLPSFKEQIQASLTEMNTQQSTELMAKGN